jgi:hypothetical protein
MEAICIVLYNEVPMGFGHAKHLSCTAHASPRVVADLNRRFERLLRTTWINNPNEDVLRRIRQQYAHRLAAVKDAEDAEDLYCTVKDMAGSSTRRHMRTQHGLLLNGPLFTR